MLDDVLGINLEKKDIDNEPDLGGYEQFSESDKRNLAEDPARGL